MPPAAFFSWMTRLTASFSLPPMAAASPENGPNTPILMVSAVDGWTDAVIDAAAIMKAVAIAPRAFRKRMVQTPLLAENSFTAGFAQLRRPQTPNPVRRDSSPRPLDFRAAA